MFLLPLLVLLTTPLAPAGDLPATWLQRFHIGWKAYERKEFAVAEKAWLSCREFDPENPTVAYHIACLKAQQAKPAAAIAWLTKAAEWGYADRAVAEWDPDLSPLRALPEFAAVLEKMEHSSPQGVPGSLRAERLAIQLPREEELLAQSNDGTRVVRGRRGTPTLEDADTGEVIAELRAPDGIVRHARFSPDSTRVVTQGIGPTLVLWDAVEGTPVAQLEFATSLIDLPAFSADSSVFVVPGTYHTSASASFDARTGELLARVPWPCDGLAALSEDGQLVFSLSSREDKRFDARIWNSTCGELVASFELAAPASERARYRASFSSDSESIALWGGGTGDVRLIAVRTGEVAQPLSIARHEIRRVAPISGTSLFLCLAPGEGLVSIDPQAGSWQPASTDSGPRAERAQRPAPRTLANQPLAWSPDGKLVALRVGDSLVRLIDVASGETSRNLPIANCSACAFSPDGSKLALADPSGIQIIDRASGSAIAGFELPFADDEGTREELELAFQPNGEHLLAFGRFVPPAVWSTRTGERVALLGNGERRGRWAAWSPDGKRIATAENARAASIWNVSALQAASVEFTAPADVELVGFSPDGALLVLGCVDARVRVWDVAKHQQVLELSHADLEPRGETRIGWAEFSRDGSKLATTTREPGDLRVWDARTGQKQYDREFEGGSAARLRARFDDAGKRLSSWGQIDFTSSFHDVERRRPALPTPGAGVDTVWPLPGDRHVVLHGRDGLRVLRAKDLRPLYQRFDVKEGGVTRTDAGWFGGDRAGARALMLGEDDWKAPLDGFASRLFDPKRVRAAIEGVELRSPLVGRLPDCRLSTRHARRVLVEADSTEIELHADDASGFVVAEDGVERLVKAGEDAPRTSITVARREDGQPVELAVRALDARGLLGRRSLVRVEFEAKE